MRITLPVLTAPVQTQVAARNRQNLRNNLLIGLLVGGGTALLSLIAVISSPLVSVGLVLGVGVGVYALTNLMFGVYLTLLSIALIPFATLPVRFALTPTFIDVALIGFLLVYFVQIMLRRRQAFRFAPAQWLIILFIGWCLFSFVAGLGHAALTTAILRKFVEMLLSMVTAIVIIDIARDEKVLRRLALMMVIFGAVQAIIGLGLYLLNDEAANRTLNILTRFGYPGGNVLRYVEDNPALGERAIGTWVDPNAYGGFLVMFGAVATVGAFAPKPLGGKRWFALAMLAPYLLVLLLTQSRGAWLAYGVALFFVALLRYRWLIAVGAVSIALLLVMPFMQPYVERLTEGLAGEDLATQMRFGEYQDSLRLIGRYPLNGVGFAGAPDRDIYLGVSSTYLKMANATGITGVVIFLLIALETLRYGLTKWQQMRAIGVAELWLGFTAAMVGALVNGVVDHYYFNLDFHAVSMAFWLMIGLSLATARYALAASPTGKALEQ